MDALDTKLLRLLREDGRAPLSALAKRLRISKQRCQYRMKHLEKERIIQNYHARVNLAVLGYSTYSLYVRFEDMDTAEEHMLIERIKSIPQVHWLVRSVGRWDLMLSVSVRTHDEFRLLLDVMLGHIGDHILEYQTSLILSTVDLWLKKDPVFEAERKEIAQPEPEAIDDNDRTILQLLEHDARLTSTELGKTIRRSPQATAKRIRRLEKEGLIHSYSATLDKERLGLTWYQVQLGLTTFGDAEQRALFGQLKQLKGIAYLVWLLGEWNFEVHLYCSHPEEFREQFLLLRKLLGKRLRSYAINVVMGKVRQSFLNKNA